MPLYGFAYSGGSVVCVDCDVYPPHTTNVTDRDPRACRRCGARLADVYPVTSPWEDAVTASERTRPS